VRSTNQHSCHEPCGKRPTRHHTVVPDTTHSATRSRTPQRCPQHLCRSAPCGPPSQFGMGSPSCPPLRSFLLLRLPVWTLRECYWSRRPSPAKPRPMWAPYTRLSPEGSNPFSGESCRRAANCCRATHTWAFCWRSDYRSRGWHACNAPAALLAGHGLHARSGRRGKRFRPFLGAPSLAANVRRGPLLAPCLSRQPPQCIPAIPFLAHADLPAMEHDSLAARTSERWKAFDE